MGNRTFCSGAPQQCVDECARLQFETRSFDAEEEHECDPAGTVFSETLQGLSSLEREALRFAGTPNLAAVRWLLNMGASPKCRDKNGTTLLHAACRSGSCLIVQELVKQGLPLDAQDSAGWTPLHVAAVMGRRDLALLLVRVKANVAVKNKKGLKPTAMCTDPGTREVLEEFTTEKTVARPHPKPFLADMLVMSPGMNHDDYSASCEPFFVPRQPLFQVEDHRAEITHLGCEMFGQSGGHGLAFFVATGAVHDHPTDLSTFLLRHRVNPVQLGEFLGEEFSLAQTLRLAYIHSVDVTGTGVVGALLKAFQHMHAPLDLSKVDRLTSAVAHLWWRTHDLGEWDEHGGMPEDGSDLDWTMFSEDLRGRQETTPRAPEEVMGMRLRRHTHSVEGLRRLMFSTMLLCWNLHDAPSLAFTSDTLGRLTFSRWLDMNVGIEVDGSNVPVYVQKGIYHTITRLGRRCPLLPGGLSPEVEGKAAALGDSVAASSALSVEDASLTVKGWAAIPRGGLERHSAHGGGAAPRLTQCVFSETSAMPTPLGSDRAVASTAKPSLTAPQEDAEAVWLSLRFNLFLFLHTGAGDDAPYAFIRLQDCILRDVSKQSRSLVLAGRPRASGKDPAAPSPGAGARAAMPFGDDHRLPLHICFLLADARFQPFEALWLELQFATDEELEMWARELGVACQWPQEPKAFTGPCGEPSPSPWSAGRGSEASAGSLGREGRYGTPGRSRPATARTRQRRPEPDAPADDDDEHGGPPAPAG